MVMMRDGPSGGMAVHAPRLVLEVVVERDGSTAGLARLASTDACLAVGVRIAPDGASLRKLLGSFPPEAVDMSPGALLAAMRPVPATRGFLACLGVLNGSPVRIVEEAVARVEPSWRMQMKVAFGTGPSGFGPPVPLPVGEVERPFSEAVDVKARPVPLAAGTRPVQGGSIDLDGKGRDHEMAGLALAWTAAMAGFVRGPLPFLDARHWSPEVHAFYLAPGRIGEYRRQAGALYPFLSPLLPDMPGVVADIDGGRPFEATLTDYLGRIADEAPALAEAGLRRMRGVTDEFPLAVLGKALAIAARFQVDRLPATPVDWRWLFVRQQALAVHLWERERGLSGMVPSLSTRHRVGTTYSRSTITEVDDMARRCAETLVGPALGLARGTRLDEARAAAAVLLFGGAGFQRAVDASARWHLNLVEFERRLPAGRDAVAWPALFEPFTRGGLTAVCLTRPSELRAEGWVGPDGDGVEGLAHCVGGYGPRCWEGTCSVVSVRAVLPDGAFRRISTAEITVRAGGRGLAVFVNQHHGPGNGDANVAALEFVNDLATRLEDGEVRHDPAALEGRSPRDYDDGVDWEAPTSLAASLDAWRPYLPRALRDATVDGLRDALRRLAHPMHGKA